MKFTFALLACVGLLVGISLQNSTDDEDHKKKVEKQKFLLEIVYRIEDPLIFEEWIQYGDKFIFDETQYTKYDKHMKLFWESKKMGALLPQGEFYGGFVKTHSRQALGLFNFFYYAKDWETFLHNVCWARMHVNEGMFVHALTLAVIHRDDLHGFVLPLIYEIFPQHFFNSKLVWMAEKFDYDVWSKNIMYEKELYDINYRINKNSNHQYSNVKDWKVWQWWKLMGLGEHWYAEEKFMLRENIYELNQEPKWTSIMNDVKMWWMPVDYTRDIEIFNDHSKLSYFTEDVGWNSYWYYLNIEYSFIAGDENFNLSKDRRGEYWMYKIQQLLSRYYMERLSHGFGEIPEFSWYHEIEYGYKPQLISYNGIGFSQRKNWWDVQTYGNFEMLNNILNTLRRIDDIIDLGYYRMNDGTIVDLSNPKSIGIILQTNMDSYEKQFFTSWYVLLHMYFGDVGYDQFDILPNVLLNYETMMRDPMFYMFHKKITDVFYRFKFHVTPYTQKELLFPGVEIKDVQVNNLVTFFDLVDFDVTNLMNDKMTFVENQFVWDKTLLARQMRLNHKPFSFNFNISSELNDVVMIRTFLGPKFDEFGRSISLTDNRENFMELDEFPWELHPGENLFNRTSEDFDWTVKDHTTYTEMYRHLMKAEFSWPNRCGFPDRLILPRGWTKGMPMQMFFIVFPFISSYYTNYSCGVGIGSSYFDITPIGYPFDRVIDEYAFFVPNIFFKDVKIYHEDTFEPYLEKYEKYGHFDYAFFTDYYTKHLL